MRNDGWTDKQKSRYNETKRPRKAFPAKEAGVIRNKLPLLAYLHVLAAKRLVSRDMVLSEAIKIHYFSHISEFTKQNLL